MAYSSLNYIYNLYKLNRVQKLSKAQLTSIQDLKLKSLVRYAYYNNDYYRRLFDQARICPDDIRKKENITRIPITTKESLRKLVSCSLVKYKTSGTTGEPLEITLSKDEEILQGLFYLRMLFANGYKIKDKLAVLTNPQYIKTKLKKNFLQRVGFLKRKYLSIFDGPEENLKKLVDFRPDIIMGYTSAIKSVTIKMRETNLKIHPRLVFCTADYLNKEDRNLIRDAFGALVLDYYSSSECGLIAWECRRQAGYHVNIDSVIVELINEGKETEAKDEGKVIITNLNSYTMPLIRYKIEDFASWAKTDCPCGSPFPLIKNIFKRQQSKQC